MRLHNERQTLKIPKLEPVTETPILPQQHPSCCPKCGAQTLSPFGAGRVIRDVRTCQPMIRIATPHTKPAMTAAEVIALMAAARDERARRDAYRHRQAVQAGRTEQTRLARAMTGGAQ